MLVGNAGEAFIGEEEGEEAEGDDEEIVREASSRFPGS